VNKPRPSRKQALEVLAQVAWSLAVVFWLATFGVSPAFARAWSYHYKPINSQPSPSASASEASITQATPAPAQQLSTAQLLKRAIISDLVLLVQEQNGGRPHKAERSEYLIRQLSGFDRLSSPGALEVFAGLSGYYLGARGEDLYDCLSLRKGKALEPYLEQYVHSDDAECSQKLRQSFTKPNDALGGYALCPSGQQQKAHLTALIAKIDSAKPCSDSDLAAATASP
jgi:hypothetical protein